MQFKYLALVAVPIAVFAQMAPAESPSSSANVLAEATIFKLGLVGMAPHFSEEESALAALLKQPDHRARLSSLLKDAKSNEGKLYALCGLRNVSKADYESGLKAVKWEGQGFNAMHADVIRKVSVKEQVERMRRDGCAVHEASS